MAKPERTLQNALDMTPELETFLGGPDAAAKPKASGKKSVKEKKSKPRIEKRQDSFVERVPFSTRIRKDLAEQLPLTLAKRKIAKKTPWTQQDVVDAAIEEWLNRNAM